MGRRTRIIGLTGSIGMGKSTAAAMLERLHVPVFYADRYAHGLLEPGGGAVTAVHDAFPDVVEHGVISRPALGRAVFGDAAALGRLEGILHPLVRQGEHAFIARQNLRRIPIAALEIPLLFETRAELLCDVVVVLTAPDFVQEARVMARPGMTKARLEAVRARQMPEVEKCRRADFVVPTGLGRRRTFLGLKAVVRKLM
ncbi:MAG: dephospho-CoA kinase [Alphaproteobacteria bacterium]|nr:dephospho-CoA kinase [Alphaproteobacteria bacterium]